MEPIHDYLQEEEQEVAPMLDSDSGSDLTQSDSDSVTDESSDPFAVFTGDGMMSRVNDLSSEYANILKGFAIGMGTAAGATEIVAVHKNSYSGLTAKARVLNFRTVMEELKNKHGELNIRNAWYAGEKLELADIVTRGFTSLHDADEFGRVRLIPMKRALDGAMGLEVEEDGLRHMLLCRVILGKMEAVAEDSIQEAPSSDEFDTGVDSIDNPRAHFVWRQSHIAPHYIVSFKGPVSLEGYDVATSTSPKAGRAGFSRMLGLMEWLRRLLSPREFKIILRLLEDYKARKLCFEELKRKARLIAGDRLISAMKLASSGVKMENGKVRDIYLPGLINVLAGILPSPKTAMLTKSLKEFRANKMSRQALARSVRVIVGDDNVLSSAIRSYRMEDPIPYPVRSMLQNGIDLSTVDVSSPHGMDDSQKMTQMSGFGMDPSKRVWVPQSSPSSTSSKVRQFEL